MSKIETPDNAYPELQEDIVSEDVAGEASDAAQEQDGAVKEEKTTEPDSSAVEDFDYIIPAKRKKHRKHKHRHRKNRGTTPTEEDMVDFVFAIPKKKKKHNHKHKNKRHKKKKMPTWLKVIIIVISVILALAIAVTATYFIVNEAGRKALHNYDDSNISIPIKDDSGKEAAKVMDNGRTIKYGGKTYRLNEDIMTVTFIGYNEDEVGESDNYMADAIYVAAIDDYTGKTTILGVSRDTMLDVDIFSADGKYMNTEKTQLSYAYSYGNDQVPGGKNVNTSLTRLFFGMPMNNYFAIDMASLEELNDAVGGVTLTSKMTFVSKETGQTVNKGDTVTLTGEDVITYVRSRDVNVLESNNTRMDRQQQYIMAFLQSIVPAAKRDLSTVTKLYGVVRKNADSTLDLPKVTYLSTAALTKLKSASEIEYIRLNGKIKAGEHAEMYLDDKDTFKTMLKVFYTPLG